MRSSSVLRLSFLLLFCLGSHSAHAQYSYQPAAEISVRVRLSTQLQKLSLEGLGFQIHGRTNGLEKIAIPQKQGVTVVRDMMNGKSIWRIQRSAPNFEVAKVEIQTERYLTLRAIDIQQGGKSLPNQILLAPRGRSSFDVIGVLPLERYLVGVLASEMPLSWPIETLKAQAIAARSYTLATVRERAKEVYHLESSILDQVYTHISHRLDDSPMISKAREAVEMTEGMVLQSANQKVVKAFYHSDCGGRTASSANVWGVGGSTGVAVDESCPTNPRAQWKLALTPAQLTEKIRSFYKREISSNVVGLRLIRSKADDRVQKVEVNFEVGKSFSMSANDLRAALGYEQLRSTMFSVSSDTSIAPEQFVFFGKGFGHGVGLCQWGARALGRQGKSYADILEHYYPRAQLFMPKLVTKNSPKLESQTR